VGQFKTPAGIVQGLEKAPMGFRIILILHALQGPDRENSRTWLRSNFAELLKLTPADRAGLPLRTPAIQKEVLAIAQDLDAKEPSPELKAFIAELKPRK
jgi:hypothetical protein